MDNFNINIVWGDKDFKKLSNENINDLKKETYSHREQSNDSKIVFYNANANTTLKKNYKIGFIGLLLMLFFCYLLPQSNNDFLVEKIAPVFFIGTGILILGLLSLPFATNQYLIFDIDKKFSQSRILKKNILGLSSTALNLDYPNPISRVVISNTADYYYITFREISQDKISNSAPIIIVNKTDQNDYSKTVELLESFIDNSRNEVVIVKI